MKLGERFGRLVVVSRAPDVVPKQTRWNCVCDCGNAKVVYATHLRSGTTVSCGCYSSEQASKRASTHGSVRHLAYRPWVLMKQRCLNPNATSYAEYGGRGVKICEQWMDFEKFLEDMGPRPSKNHQIDRMDNGGDYEPKNCRWATRREQQNNRAVTKFVIIDGAKRPLADVAREYGIKRTTLYMRLFRCGWSLERALKR